eukprot:COSAG02_NODE_2077_length_9916_cov_9.422489_4_plen_457_part_00
MDLASFFKPKKAAGKAAQVMPPKVVDKASSESLSPASSPASEPVGKSAVAPAQPKASAATPKAAAPKTGAAIQNKAPSDFFKPRVKKAVAKPSPDTASAKKPTPVKTEGRPDEEEPSIQSQGERLTTGDVVWAKYDDYPWWPCYLSADPDSGQWIDDGKVRVIFFGDDTEAWLSQRKVQPFLKNLSRHRKDPQIQEALSEALNKLNRADLIEDAVHGTGEDSEEAEENEGRSRRSRRVTSQEKQRAAAKKILTVNKPKRLKKSQPSDDEEDDLDLGLPSDEEEHDDGDDSGSEYGRSDSSAEEEEEEEDLSEGEPEEDVAPPSEASEESEEEEDVKPQRKRKRVSFGADTKKGDSAQEDAPASGRASIDALNAFACDAASSEAAASKARQKKRASSPPAANRSQKTATTAAAAGAAPVGRVGMIEEMDSSEWESIAEQGDYKRARQVRFQQWMNTG